MPELGLGGGGGALQGLGHLELNLVPLLLGAPLRVLGDALGGGRGDNVLGDADDIPGSPGKRLSVLGLGGGADGGEPEPGEVLQVGDV